MAGGAADLALGRSDDVILAVSRAHLPLVIVWAYMERDPMAVLVHAEGPVRDFPDLAGRPVMADPASAWIPYLKAKYKMDFPIIPLNYGLGGFLADPAYIVQGFATAEPYFIRQRGQRVRTLLIANAGYNPYRVVYANTGFVRAHPGAVRAFIAASLRGWQDYLGPDPAPADRAIAALNPAMTADYLAFSRRAARPFATGDPARGERLGLMTRRRLEEQVEQFVQLGLLPAPLPVDQFARFDFLPPDPAAPPTPP